MGHVSHDDLAARIRGLETLQQISSATFSGQVYLVGGALREIALGCLPKDYDFALGRPADLTTLENLLGTRAFILGKKPIQTYRIVTGALSLDITFLKEGIEQDLARRDFTINAIAYDVRDGCLIDPLGGLQDLNRRVIRQPQKERLIEDPLRMLKAIRHFASLSGFSIAPELAKAIEKHKDLIATTAPERIKYELDLIITAPQAHRGIALAVETGLLFRIIPEFLPMVEMDREKGFELEAFGHTIEGFRHEAKASSIYTFDDRQLRDTAYSLLFHDLGKPYTFSFDEAKKRVHFFHHERYSRGIASRVMDRLRFSTAEIKVISTLIENHMRLFLISHPDSTDKAIRRLVYKMGDLTPGLVLLTLLDMYGTTKGTENPITRQVRKRCTQALAAYEEWKKEPLPRIVNGHDLLSLGFSEGPFLGRVLEEVREKQIAGEITEKEGALEYAARVLGEADRG